MNKHIILNILLPLIFVQGFGFHGELPKQGYGIYGELIAECYGMQLIMVDKTMIGCFALEHKDKCKEYADIKIVFNEDGSEYKMTYTEFKKRIQAK